MTFLQLTQELICCFLYSKWLETKSAGSYVIVIAQVPGIYGSKQTESQGVAPGQGLFTTAINPLYIPPD